MIIYCLIVMLYGKMCLSAVFGSNDHFPFSLFVENPLPNFNMIRRVEHCRSHQWVCVVGCIGIALTMWKFYTTIYSNLGFGPFFSVVIFFLQICLWFAFVSFFIPLGQRHKLWEHEQWRCSSSTKGHSAQTRVSSKLANINIYKHILQQQ